MMKMSSKWMGFGNLVYRLLEELKIGIAGAV